MINIQLSAADAAFLCKDMATRAKRVKDVKKARQMERIARRAGDGAMVPVKQKDKRVYQSAKQRVGLSKTAKRRAVRK